MNINLLLQHLSNAEIVGLTIIGEARGEAIESQVGVGCVIRNRLDHNPSKYRNYADVCLEPKQFSCWNLNDPNYQVLINLANKQIRGDIMTDVSLRQCMWIADGIVSRIVKDNTNGALNYLNRALFGDSEKRPDWANKPKNISYHGNHVFFTALAA